MPKEEGTRRGRCGPQDLGEVDATMPRPSRGLAWTGNIGAWLCDNVADSGGRADLLLNSKPCWHTVEPGKQTHISSKSRIAMSKLKTLGLSFVTALALVASQASSADAACYADYRAQQQSPVRFHYGVAQIPDSACGNAQAAANYLRSRLQRNGWTLVNVLSTFGQSGLASRQGNAGQYFLRF